MAPLVLIILTNVMRFSKPAYCFLITLTELEFSTGFSRTPSINFQANPCSRSRIVSADEQTDMTRIIFIFRNFAKKPIYVFKILMKLRDHFGHIRVDWRILRK